MRAFAFALVFVMACGPHANSHGDANGSGGPDACIGIGCNVSPCAMMGKPPTSISGTVFAPNGTLPLYGVSVYVPAVDPGPLPTGASCSKCSDGLPGQPVVQALTDEHGKFQLLDVPDGDNIPVVIQIGKWRRQIKLAHVAACGDQSLIAADTTLPKSHDDMTPNTTRVDMPKIAISTGSADSLECLIRRLGIADKEITTDAQSGRIHLYSDTQSLGAGVGAFDPGYAGGSGAFSDSQTLWGNAINPGKLANYDIVILSCEGAQEPTTKPQQAMDHLKAYADMGGRVFLSHWHNIWIEGSKEGGNQAPAVWPQIATFNGGGLAFPTDDMIDETDNPKGMSFATWMMNVGGSTQRDHIALATGTGKSTCSSVDKTKAELWVNWQNGGSAVPQYFQFTTPNEATSDQRCGKVVFSDMHVSGGPGTGNYPTSCGGSTALSAQEKALAFMFFDISSCVGSIF